jgi:NADH:ubiquinone oxidoreductase subunit 2 (chain N)
MNNLNFIYPEIFISLSMMFLLIIGVFKKKSSDLVFLLSAVTLLISLGALIKFPSDQELFLFNESYKIDQLSTFMKIVTIISGIFVLISSYKYVKLVKLLKS